MRVVPGRLARRLLGFARVLISTQGIEHIIVSTYPGGEVAVHAVRPERPALLIGATNTSQFLHACNFFLHPSLFLHSGPTSCEPRKRVSSPACRGEACDSGSSSGGGPSRTHERSSANPKLRRGAARGAAATRAGSLQNRHTPPHPAWRDHRRALLRRRRRRIASSSTSRCPSATLASSGSSGQRSTRAWLTRGIASRPSQLPTAATRCHPPWPNLSPRRGPRNTN